MVPKAFGQFLEVNTLIDLDLRDGLDMVWGTSPDYGHFGLDLTGQNGGAIRIESLQIEDVSAIFMLQNTKIGYLRLRRHKRWRNPKL